MEHTTKILISTLHLKDFTAAELARFAEAKPSTVNTVLTRNSHLFKRVLDDVTPRRRGGRSYRYQLRSDSAVQIREKYSKFLELPLLVGAPDSDDRCDEISQSAITAIYEFVDAFPETDDINDEVQDIRLKRGLILLRSVKNHQKANSIDAGLGSARNAQIQNLLSLTQFIADFSKLTRKYQRNSEPTIDFLLELIVSHSKIQRLLIEIITEFEVSPELKRMANIVSSSHLLNLAVDIESITDVITSNTSAKDYQNLFSTLPIYAESSNVNSDDVDIYPKDGFTSGRSYTISTNGMSDAVACAMNGFVEATSLESIMEEL